MWRLLPVFVWAVGCANAQSLSFSVVADSGTESPVSQIYGFGQIAPGKTQSVRFRIRNTGTSTSSLTALTLTAPSANVATGFMLVNPPSLPYSLAASGTVDFTITFSNSTAGNYSATLSVNNLAVILLATSTPTAVLTASPCTGPDAAGAITFTTPACTFTLTNPTAQAFPVYPVTLSGAAFSGLPSAYTNGVTLPPSQSVTFVLTSSGSTGTATLTVGLKTYTLSAAGAGLSSSGPLAISFVGGDGTETLLNTPATFDFFQVAAGDAKTVHFRARNTGSSAVTITTLCVGPTGASCPVTASNYFSVVNSSSPPQVIAPANSMDFYVRFSAAVVNNYTATLLVNAQQVNLTAAAVPAATLSVASPCTGPDVTATISFGRVAQNGQVVCVFTIKNPNAQDLAVPVALTGAAFSGLISNSITVPANQSIPITFTFTATSAAILTGTLVTGTRSYTLSGTGFSAPVPAPSLTFDAATFSSGEQHTLTVSLPSPSTVTTTGTLTLSFSSQATGITDDAAIMFVATGSRAANYAITAGSTAITINGKSSITFSTGTTAGKITFAMTAGIYGFAGDPTTTRALAPMPIAISATGASRKTGEVDVSITGFDNTYTAGAMTFTFYDKSGTIVGQPVNADFTANFVRLYQNQTVGSGFIMGVAFPVTGDATVVGSVDVALKNSAGTTKASRLSFP